MTNWQILLGSLLSFLATLLAGPKFISFMRRKQYGQTTLDDGPSWHKAKSGTPTMGGLVFLVASSLVAILVGLFSGHLNFLLLAGVLGFAFFGSIGFMDDYLKIFKKQNEGLKRGQKFSAQLLGSGLFVGLYFLAGQAPVIQLPLLGPVQSWIFFFLFSLIWITGFSNAVNLTDGIDGLAGTTNVVAYGAYGFYALSQNQVEISLFCFSVLGGLLGFLVYNWKPAKFFMGDVGSLALGAGLAIVSLMLQVEWTLLLVGIIFVLETASVILQVASFQLLGKRIFKMSPIHHHFEMVGWSEVKIVTIFSLIGLLGASILFL